MVVILCFGTLTLYLTNSPAVLMQAYGLGPERLRRGFRAGGHPATPAAICSTHGWSIACPWPLLVEPERWPAAPALGAGLALAVAASGIGGVWAVVASMGLFFVAFGLVAANATTLALQPHAAGAGAATAALGFAQTVVPTLLGGLVALLFDGTAIPMLATILALFVLGWLVARLAPRGR